MAWIADVWKRIQLRLWDIYFSTEEGQARLEKARRRILDNPQTADDYLLVADERIGTSLHPGQ